MNMTDEARLEDAVQGMVWWLKRAAKPVDVDLVDPNPYRHLDDDELELGERVADELLSEWAHSSVDGMCAVLASRVNRAARRPSPTPVEPEPTPLPDGPGVTLWLVPAYAPYVMPLTVLRSITAWMDDNGVEHADGTHEVRVEVHPGGERTIAYWRGRQPSIHETYDDTVTPARVLLRTEPPALPDFPDLEALGEVIDAHPVGVAHFNMPLPFGSQICVTCTRESGALQPVTYPCPPLVAAASAADVEIYPDEDGAA